MLHLMLLIISTISYAPLESIRIHVQFTFVTFNPKIFANNTHFRRKSNVNDNENVDSSDLFPDYLYKPPNEYRILTNVNSSIAKSSNQSSDIQFKDQLVNAKELEYLEISDKTNYFDLDNKNSVDNSTSLAHPLDNPPTNNIETPNYLPNSNLVDDLYYSDILLSAKSKETKNIDFLSEYENELFNSAIVNDQERDCIEESLLEANRVIQKPEDQEDADKAVNQNYVDTSFPQIDRLPNKNTATGEYLIDRHLIHKVACLRSCLEMLEKGIARKSAERGVKDVGEGSSQGENENPLIDIFTCFNSPQMKLFKKLILDEGLFEEVVGRAMAIYERSGDTESLERITWIASQLGPWVNQLRKDAADEKINELVKAAMKDVNSGDLSNNDTFIGLLWDYSRQGLLDKYIVKRCEEIISEAGKKYRIDERTASLSEIFLTSIKNQIIAQMITSLNGTDLYVRTLIRCLRVDRSDWRSVVNGNIRTMEEVEEFVEWLNVGAEYLSRTERPGKVVSAEDLLEVVDELTSGVEN